MLYVIYIFVIFDLAYLMLFYLSTGISNTILSLISLLYLLLESWLLHLWVSFDVDKALLKSY